MKRNVFYTLTALLMAGAAFTACGSDEEVVNVPTTEQTWQICIPATKGIDVDTRALNLDGKTLMATWTTSDEIYVAKGTEVDANVLKPDRNGSSANLEGTLVGTYEVGDELTLIYGFYKPIPSFLYKWLYYQYGMNDVGQNGTLESLQYFDFASAKVAVTAVDGGKITTTPASFKPCQSIFKLTFTDGTNPVRAKNLKISSTNNKLVYTYDILNEKEEKPDGLSLSVNIDTPSSEVYVALRMDESVEESGKIIFRVEDEDGYIYEGTKTATATMPVNGKYYVATVTVKKTGEQNTLKITPSESYTVSGTAYTVIADATATGKADEYFIRTEADNVTLTIDNVELTNGSIEAARHQGIVFILEGTNKVKSTDLFKAGVTFKGTGSLTFGWYGSTPLDLNSEDYTGVKLDDGLELINNEDGTYTIKPAS
ncbi:MAG: hypothetical protein J6T82_03870 [Bacteroidaceae bacterium]|nr:hypothetical protein [Bacteroidaceae bacterium]